MEKLSRSEMLKIVNRRQATDKLRLHLGAGHIIKPDYINLDIAPLKGIDVVHNLNKLPYPFEDNSFDEVAAYAILEHLDDLVGSLEEIYRICRNRAILKVDVPYWNSVIVWADPTHKRGFTLDTFTYFSVGSSRGYYGKVRWKIIRQRAVPSKVGRFVPGPIRKLLSPFISNLFDGIQAEMEIVK